MADRAARHNAMKTGAARPSGGNLARVARWAPEDPGMASKRIEMELYTEPPGSSVITSRTAPAVTGEGNTDYVCGACATVICRSMRQGEVDGVAFRCPQCWRVNRVKG